MSSMGPLSEKCLCRCTQAQYQLTWWIRSCYITSSWNPDWRNDNLAMRQRRILCVYVAYSSIKVLITLPLWCLRWASPINLTVLFRFFPFKNSRLTTKTHHVIVKIFSPQTKPSSKRFNLLEGHWHEHMWAHLFVTVNQQILFHLQINGIFFKSWKEIKWKWEFLLCNSEVQYKNN